MINKNYMYTLTDNCVPRMGDHGNIVSLFGKDIDIRSDMEVDLRLSLVSYGSTKDMSEYFRYFHIVSSSAARRLASEDFMKGTFVAMLDNGFVPFYMPPTYMPADLGEMFRSIVQSTGIKFVEEKAMRFDGLKIDSICNDIWISRPAAAKYARCDLEDFNVLNFMRGLLENAYN